MSIDSYRHRITLHGEQVRVTQIEYELLRCLAVSSGKVVSYREIAIYTHGQDMDDAEARLLLKQHVRNLRNKIGSEYLVNVRSTGYMLVDPTEKGRPGFFDR
ncbi:MAG: winged helix-turn-helix transcriptional regulator [Chloroflexaceae bacterium]|nr:winged helix-turn-helix transcriptional regulator [Chloroflexaceae bacterium]